MSHAYLIFKKTQVHRIILVALHQLLTAYLAITLPTYLPIQLHICIHTHLPASILTYISTYIYTYISRQGLCVVAPSLEGTLYDSIFRYPYFKTGRILRLLFRSGGEVTSTVLSFLVRNRRGLTSMILHLLFRSGRDLMSIYRQKVHLAPKHFLLLPLVIYLVFRLMITFALCSTVFHSYGWWTFPKYDAPSELCTTLGPSYYSRA
jgi:hypothetical protein